MNKIENSSEFIKTTKVDICKIYILNKEKKITLVAITFTNFYSGRNYIKFNIKKSFKQFYYTELCDKFSVTTINNITYNNNSNIKYLLDEHYRPVTIVSEFPPKCRLQSMENILEEIIYQYDGKPDPENEKSIIKFNYMPDFILDTIYKQKYFNYICQLI